MQTRITMACFPHTAKDGGQLLLYLQYVQVFWLLLFKLDAQWIVGHNHILEMRKLSAKEFLVSFGCLTFLLECPRNIKVKNVSEFCPWTFLWTENVVCNEV